MLGDFDSIEHTITKHTLLLVDDQIDREPTFNLYNRILKGINESPKTHNSLMGVIMNGLGFISESIGLVKEAINFYLLGLLCSKGRNSHLCYNNLGACFSDLLDYKVAKVYNQKVLDSDSYGSAEEKRTDRIYNLSMTNLAISNANLGNIEEAKKQLEQVYQSNYTIVVNLHRYTLWLLEVATNQNNIEKAVNFIKELEKDKSKFPYTFYLRKYLIDEVKGIPIKTRYAILLGSFDLLHVISNISDKKRTILGLIELSKKLGKKTEEVKFKDALYELSLLEVNYNTTITRIIIEQYLLFFNDLTQSYKKTKHQTEELAKLTFLLSHNLKTPIRSISGFTELIRKKLQSSVDTETEEYFNLVNNDCNELYSLLTNINQIIDIDKKTSSSSTSGLQQLINELEANLNGNNSN